MRVRALSLSPVVPATQVCVIALRRTLEARTSTLGKSVRRAVAATCHGLTPLQCRAERLFSAKWSVSNPMALGETPASAIAKADIYIN